MKPIYRRSLREAENNASKVYIGNASIEIWEEWYDGNDKFVNGYELPHLNGIYNTLDEFIKKATKEFNIWEWYVSDSSESSTLFANADYEDADLNEPWTGKYNKDYENGESPVYRAGFDFQVYHIEDFTLEELAKHPSIEEY